MNRKQDAGFTMIELLIVIAILGILLAVSMGSYSRWRASTAVMEGAQQFARDVDRVRTNAKREGVCWLIKPTAAADATTYELQKFSTASCTGTATSTQTKSMPNGTRLTTESAGAINVNFTPPYGTTDAGPNKYKVSWANNPSIARVVRVTSVLGRTVIK